MIYLLIGYMWLFIHRPFEEWPVLGSIRLEFLYISLTIVCWGLSGRRRWISDPLQYAFLGFWAAVLLCWLLSPWSAVTQPGIENYFKLVVFYVLLVTSVRDEAELKLVVAGFIGVMGLYMAHSFREFLSGRHVYRMGLARMVGVGGTLSDPNSFSASVLYALPLISVVWNRSAARWWKVGRFGYIALSVLCILLTGSRSALVGLVVLGLLYVAKTRRRVRTLFSLAVAASIIWVCLPPHLQNRFYTLIDPSVGPTNAQTSAEGRAEGWKNGLVLFSQYPLTGCGPFAWRPATGSELESHQLYGQILGEMGLAGVLSFGAVVGLLFWECARIKAGCRELSDPEGDFLRRLSQAVQVSLILLLVLGFGGHNLFRYSWLWYGGFLVLARQCVLRKTQQGHRPGGPRRSAGYS